MKPSELFLLQRHNKFCGGIIFLSGGQLKILEDQSGKHTRMMQMRCFEHCCKACLLPSALQPYYTTDV